MNENQWYSNKLHQHMEKEIAPNMNPKSQDSNFASRQSVRTQIPHNTRVIRKNKFVPTLLSQIQTQSIQHKKKIQKGTKKD